jgi:integrase/recombinase XerD
MAGRRCAMIPLHKAVEEYLAMRRSLGYKLIDMGYNLRHFTTFMNKQNASVITTKLALRWAVQPQHVTPAQWAARLSYVRSFARYRSTFDPRTEVPPVGLLPYRFQRTTPYIYSKAEIQGLLKAATKLSPGRGLRPWTYYTVFGLMTVTGMRIGEVIRLEYADVDLAQALLTIRLTKFSKYRLVPLHASTVRMLHRYLQLRDRLHPKSSTTRFFLSNQGRPLTDCMVRWTFVKLSRQIGLRRSGESFGPRLHDLRHRFAVTTLLHWYRTGIDVEQRLPVLSTFLGHVHVTDTYWYLSAIPELLALTKARLERRWEALS